MRQSLVFDCRALQNQILADEQLDPATGALDQLLWPLGDNLDTIRDLAVYDAVLAETTIANHLTYDSYGQITSESNPSVDHLFAFTGREWGEDAGLYYYRARWYDTAVGRFVSEDPIGYSAQDANLHRYVRNNPTNNVDPTGLEIKHDPRTGTYRIWRERKSPVAPRSGRLGARRKDGSVIRAFGRGVLIAERSTTLGWQLLLLTDGVVGGKMGVAARY